MKKLLMGLTAVVATSFAVPAFADDAPAGDKAEKKEKGHGKKKGGEEKKPEAPAK